METYQKLQSGSRSYYLFFMNAIMKVMEHRLQFTEIMINVSNQFCYLKSILWRVYVWFMVKLRWILVPADYNCALVLHQQVSEITINRKKKSVITSKVDPVCCIYFRKCLLLLLRATIKSPATSFPPLLEAKMVNQNRLAPDSPSILYLLTMSIFLEHWWLPFKIFGGFIMISHFSSFILYKHCI